MELKKRIFLITSWFLISLNACLFAQTDFKNKFDDKVNVTIDQRIKEAREGNSYYFMILGYFINANNNMYKKTKDVTYLTNNSRVINEIVKAGQKSKKKGQVGDKWLANFRDKIKFASVNHKEVPLYEGYGFRYIAEYYYLLKCNNVSFKNDLLTIDFIVNNFEKWAKRSSDGYGDYSMLHRERVHMGAQWATVAMYLYKLTGSSKYLTIYNQFNNELKNNLKIQNFNTNKYYMWNATYSNKFTASLRRSLPRNIIQDVSHGNHVIQFVVDSYELGIGEWKLLDLQLFGNTIKNRVWNQEKKSFSDNVDGTNSKDKDFKNTGWKQADGWMRLIPYVKSLKGVYEDYYSINKQKIDSNPGISLQFYANMF